MNTITSLKGFYFVLENKIKTNNKMFLLLLNQARMEKRMNSRLLNDLFLECQVNCKRENAFDYLPQTIPYLNILTK